MKKGYLFVGAQFTLIALLVVAPKIESSTPQSILGLSLIGIGLFGIGISMKQLGKALTALPEAKPEALLVTEGIYGLIRHPIYFFLLAAGLGVVIYKGSLAALTIFLLLGILIRFKYRYEDAILRTKWPEAKKYQARVPALIPKLRK